MTGRRSIDPGEVDGMVREILESRKYRHTHAGTVRAVVQAEVERHSGSRKEAEKAARKRLHQIMAPYVGEPDYAAARSLLETAFAAGDAGEVQAACSTILRTHFSTRERLEIIPDFYRQIFAVTGEPRVLLDVACAINPLTFPWMGLPPTLAYHAYDIHAERIDFLNDYFRLQGMPPLAHMQDIALQFPEEEGDVALFLKELPRFEDNYDRRGLALLDALRVRFLVVSYPTISLHGGRSIAAAGRRHWSSLTAGRSWTVTEMEFKNELVFVADKHAGMAV